MIETPSGWALVASAIALVVIAASAVALWRARSGPRRVRGASAVLFAITVAFLVAVLLESNLDDDTPGASRVELAEDDAGRMVTIARNDKVVVALEANPSTGYRWSVRDPAPAQLRAKGDPEFVAAAAGAPLVGAGGVEVFTFRAVASGTATLTLDYARSWEKGVPPDKSWSVTIVVR